MTKATLVLALATIWASAAVADYSATYYELGSGRAKKLFTSEHKIESKDGVDHIATSYKDPEGKVLYQEKATVAGNDIKKIEIEQKQTEKTGLVEVKDGKIHFSTKQGEKAKDSKESLGSTFVMSANFQRFIKAHWPEIMAGKAVDFRFGAWERLETVGFSVKKEKETEVQGQKAVVIKMKPSSFIIAAIVDPLHFTFAADGSRLLEMTGLMPIKLKSGSDFKDLKAEAVYSY